MSCQRCGKEGEAPKAHRVGLSAAGRERILGAICGECWREWEAVELKVLNEYRLNLMDPEHRTKLESVCFEFLGLQDS